MSEVLPRRIALIKNRALGDSLMGVATVSYVRQLFPKAFIAYVLPSWIAPLYQQVDIAADEIWPMDFHSLSDWRQSWQVLAAQKIDLIYEMFQSGRTRKFFALYSFCKRIPYFFHNHHQKRGPVHQQGNVWRAAIQRDLDGVWTHLANHKGILPSYLDYPPRLEISEKPERGKKIIFGVVAARETKQWGIARYLALARLIEQHFPAYDILLPLSSAPRDQALGQEIQRSSPPSNVHIVYENLSALPVLFAQAKLYIGNDTGLKHLAVSVGTKSYTLFGPEPPTEWHPYCEKIHPYFFIQDMPCRTEKAHYCGLSSCAHMSCLAGIQVTEVFQKLQDEL